MKKIKNAILDFIFDKFGERYNEYEYYGYSQDDFEIINMWRLKIFNKKFIRECKWNKL